MFFMNPDNIQVIVSEDQVYYGAVKGKNPSYYHKS